MDGAIDRNVGTGWGAVSLLKKLDTENYNGEIIIDAID